jgi:hypothetical protein
MDDIHSTAGQPYGEDYETNSDEMVPKRDPLINIQNCVLYKC